MAWTTPKTFTAGTVLTAAELNTHLRDNLNETCPATATTAGDLIYADAANSMGSRVAIGGARSILYSSGSAPAWTGTPSAGSFLVSDSTGNPVWRQAVQAEDNTIETIGSASYIGWSPSVSVTATTGQRVLVSIHAHVGIATSGDVFALSYAISGATTAAASDNFGTRGESAAANQDVSLSRTRMHTGLTGGSNTFELEAKRASGTGNGNFDSAGILVVPIT